LKNIKIEICINVVLPVAVYGCQTWSLTFREEQGLKMFENGLMKKMSRARGMT